MTTNEHAIPVEAGADPVGTWAVRLSQYGAQYGRVTKTTAAQLRVDEVYLGSASARTWPRERVRTGLTEEAAKLMVERIKSANAECSRREQAARAAYNQAVARILAGGV